MPKGTLYCYNYTNKTRKLHGKMQFSIVPLIIVKTFIVKVNFRIKIQFI